MKTILVVVAVLAGNIFAQSNNDSVSTKTDSTGFRLSSIDVSSGKGAVSSGLYVYLNLASDQAILQTTISENDLEVTYFLRLLDDKILIGPNAGFFLNSPYGGPMMVFSPMQYVSTLHWCGWSFGKPEGPVEGTPSFLFAVNAITATVWRVSATYCLINYMDNKPQHTVDLKYAQGINRNFSIYTNIGYDFLNQSQLLKIGVNWVP